MFSSQTWSLCTSYLKPFLQVRPKIYSPCWEYEAIVPVWLLALWGILLLGVRRLITYRKVKSCFTCSHHSLSYTRVWRCYGADVSACGKSRRGPLLRPLTITFYRWTGSKGLRWIGASGSGQMGGLLHSRFTVVMRLLCDYMGSITRSYCRYKSTLLLHFVCITRLIT